MRILHVIDSFGVGGAETLLLSLIHAATARGHEVHLAYFTPGPLGDQMAAAATSVTRLSHHGLRDPRALFRAWRLIRRLRPEVVHTHLTKSELVGQLAARLAGTPIRVLTLHNTDPWRRSRALSTLYRLVTGGVHHVIAVSDEVARFAVETEGVDERRVCVIRNGVDIAKFAPVVTLQAPRRPVMRCAVIGRLQPQKDHATFLQAVRLLTNQGIVAEFLVIGDGPLRTDLQLMAESLGIGAKVSFTGNQQDMPKVLASLDAVILSSAWEGLPMVLLEAMAAGKAVVATSVGEVPALISDGLDGLLVPPGDPVALAAAMARVIAEPGLAGALGKASRRTIEAGYSDAAMFDRIFALYRKDQG